MSDTLGVETFEPVLTTDGASNMKKAASSEEGVFWLRCILHTFHNGVIKGLQEVDK